LAPDGVIIQHSAWGDFSLTAAIFVLLLLWFCALLAPFCLPLKLHQFWRWLH
jgi:hypothetical protein